MKLLSLNVGIPRTVLWNGKHVTTGMFKSPVTGPQALGLLNLAGDRQADLSVHGGVDKAVYGYPSEHYGYWQAELPDTDLPWGMFGENFTTEGLFEDQLVIGERFRIGTAEVRVSELRMPCYKLGIRFGRADMVKRFMASRRTGFYFAVVQPGVVAAGDVFESVARPAHAMTIADLTRVVADDHADVLTMQRLAEVEELSDGWRDYVREQLHRQRTRGA